MLSWYLRTHSVTIPGLILLASSALASGYVLVERLSISETEKDALVESANTALGPESKPGIKEIDTFRDFSGRFGTVDDVVGEVVYNIVNVDQTMRYFYSVRCKGPSWNDLNCDDIWQTKYIRIQEQTSEIEVLNDIGFDEAKTVLAAFFEEESACLPDQTEQEFSSLARAWAYPETKRDYQKYSLRLHPSSYVFTVSEGKCELEEIACCSY
jgi:hypothetical protein